MEPDKSPPDPIRTEEKIKEAARKLFTEKGYAGTRTRDIAEAAGINLALLNYYFRSKEKLFQQVMMEKVQQLFGQIAPVLQNHSISLEEKVERIVSLYIDMMGENPNLPLFVLSEIRNHPDHFVQTLKVDQLFRESSMMKQLMERRPDTSPIHFFMSILGMTLFPFIAMPVFKIATGMPQPHFDALMAERKVLIPVWTKAILNATVPSPSPDLTDPTK